MEETVIAWRHKDTARRHLLPVPGASQVKIIVLATHRLVASGHRRAVHAMFQHCLVTCAWR